MDDPADVKIPFASFPFDYVLDEADARVYRSLVQTLMDTVHELGLEKRRDKARIESLVATVRELHHANQELRRAAHK